MPVHHIEVKGIRPTPLRLSDRRGEVGEIRAQEGGSEPERSARSAHARPNALAYLEARSELQEFVRSRAALRVQPPSVDADVVGSRRPSSDLDRAVPRFETGRGSWEDGGEERRAARSRGSVRR